MAVFQVDLVYPIQMVAVLLFTILVWYAAGILWFRLWKSGGIASLFYFFFFSFMGLMAICDIPAVSAGPGYPEQATFWGTLGLMAGLTAWFAVYLSSEYGSSDRPLPWRITMIGIWYGVCLCGLFMTLLLPPGAGAVIMTYIAGYGWSLSVTPFFLVPLAIFIISSVFLFFRFCFQVHQAAPGSPYGHRCRVFVQVIMGGFSIVIILSMMRFVFIENARIIYTSEIFLSAVFLSLIFYLFNREPGIVFLLAQRAACIFVLNTAGTVYFEHSFENVDALTEYIDLFAPALTAVNFIVRESLELREVEWIREFRTNRRTFLLDVRLEAELIGVLLVSQPTQMLRLGLSQLMASLITELSLRGTQIDFSKEMKEKFVELVHKAFPFLKT